MIISLVFKGQYNVGVSSTNKVKIDGHSLSMKDIPFVRYRFDKYDAKAISFIQANMKKFNGPVHLAEIPLSENTVEILKALPEKVARFVYVPVDDNDILMNSISDEKLDMVSPLSARYDDFDCTRLMIKDNTSLMYPLIADNFKKQLEEATNKAFKSKDIGVCGSSLSFRSDDTPGQACLTAVWARAVMAEYADNDDIVVPSASHECMNCCGCIQYLTIESDIPAPASGKSAKKTVKEIKAESDNPNEVQKNPKTTKKVAKGAVTWIGI